MRQESSSKNRQVVNKQEIKTRKYETIHAGSLYETNWRQTKGAQREKGRENNQAQVNHMRERQVIRRLG